jgi:hypothetical protein
MDKTVINALWAVKCASRGEAAARQDKIDKTAFIARSAFTFLSPAGHLSCAAHLSFLSCAAH